MRRIKKIVSVLLTVSAILVCSGCGAGSSSGETGSGDRLEVISQEEYVLYQNVFYKDFGKELDGKRVIKEGVFAVLNDAFNNCSRYYVWGYYDQTKCCDWQWEFVPNEASDLPPAGSLVTVEGLFVSSTDALDGYWIAEANVKANTEYTGMTSDLDMYSMSCTLERVQMINVLRHPEIFQNREFTAYGRIASPDSLEDPYYDGSWEIKIVWDGDLPAVGTLVAVTGSIRDGSLIVQTLKII